MGELSCSLVLFGIALTSYLSHTPKPSSDVWFRPPACQVAQREVPKGPGSGALAKCDAERWAGKETFWGPYWFHTGGGGTGCSFPAGEMRRKQTFSRTASFSNFLVQTLS